MVFILDETLVGFVLQAKKGCNPLFIPTKFAQIVSATTGVNAKKKFGVFDCGGPERNRLRIQGHGLKIGRSVDGVNTFGSGSV